MRGPAWLVVVMGCGAGAHAPPASTAPLIVRMERGGVCFPAEVCPSYTLALYGDGVVEYDGERDTSITGQRRGRIDRATMNQLEGQLARVVPALRDAYPSSDCTDQAVVTLTYRGRVIHHDFGDRAAPFELYEIENLFDALVQSERWIGRSIFLGACMGAEP